MRGPSPQRERGGGGVFGASGGPWMGQTRFSRQNRHFSRGTGGMGFRSRPYFLRGIALKSPVGRLRSR